MNIFHSNHTIEKLLGTEDRFSLSQQLFHAITFCIALIASLMGLSDCLLKLGPHYYLFSFFISITSAALYTASRRGANYRKVIIPYFLMAGCIIIYVWKMLNAFSGSMLLINLALSITIPMISSGWLKRGAFLTQQGLIGLLFYLKNNAIAGAELSPETTDRVATTLILSLGCYMGISFMMKNSHNQKQKLRLLNEKMEKANQQLQQRKEKLEEAIAEIRELNQLLPICCNCKKIRDDKGYWLQLEHYFYEHRDTTFSHGICPECAADIYGQYFDPENAEPSKIVG